VPYQAFKARDDYLMIGAGNERLWRAVCEVIGAPEWATDPRFDSTVHRVLNRNVLVKLIEERLQAKTRDEWVETLSAAGVPAGPINTIDQVFNDPQVLHRGLVEEVEHPTAGRVRLVGVPVKFSDTPGEIRRSPPSLGQHTEEVLSGLLEYSPDEISALRADGVI
jgi:crotonobetainyl-CoA:carnitine CoA-transferase CaiB-like acyl-CoA transferase